ncbi:MAG: PilN domain-containing protein [Gammaproteobacteria bacterium]|nr:PilN domain-containing protein [Gammaproteobacteria bacterium]
MRQKINFYDDSLKPKSDLLSLDTMLLAWLVGLMVSVVIYVFEWQQLSLVEERKNQAIQQQAHQQVQLSSLQANFSKRGDVTVLSKTLEDMNKRRDKLVLVLQQLGLRTQGMEQGVAGIMSGLTELDIKALWLTEISVYQGQLSLVGQTRDPRRVPQLIEKLQQLSGLSDRRFARLHMLSDEENNLHEFSLQSVDFVAPQAPQRGN